MKGIRVPIACWSFTLCSSDLAKLDQQWLDNELQFPVYLSHFQFSWGKMDQDDDCRKVHQNPLCVLLKL